MKRIALLSATLLASGLALADGTCVIPQSTSGNVKLGPFYDSVDHVTLLDDLVLTQPDIRRSRQTDATFAQKSDSSSCTSMGAGTGMYTCPYGTGDSNIRGELIWQVTESGADLVQKNCVVMGVNAHAAHYGATSPATETAVTTVGSAVATAQTDLDDLTDNGAKVRTGGITTASYAAGAINAAALAIDAANEIRDAVDNSLVDGSVTRKCADAMGLAYHSGAYERTGANPYTATYRNPGDSANRLGMTYTTDAAGGLSRNPATITCP